MEQDLDGLPCILKHDKHNVMPHTSAECNELEGLRSSGTHCCTVGQVVPTVLKKRCASVFKGLLDP